MPSTEMNPEIIDILMGTKPSAYKEGVWNRYFPAVSCALFGVALAMGANLGMRRPLRSGIQKHIIGFAAGGYIGEGIYHWRKSYYADRDAILRHYIELHPEDFERPPKVYYRNILEPWTPVR